MKDLAAAFNAAFLSMTGRREADAINDGEPPDGGLDRLIHTPLRLGIMSALAAHGAITFNDLKEILKATDGNVAVHARKLEDAEYIQCRKTFVGRRPQTEYTITDKG